jgi:hypothetical protein
MDVPSSGHPAPLLGPFYNNKKTVIRISSEELFLVEKNGSGRTQNCAAMALAFRDMGTREAARASQ